MKSVIRRKPYLIPIFILLGIGAMALFGWIVMALWNAVLVPAVGANIISFWQALGILVLSRILVGGFGGGKSYRRRGDWEKCKKMTPEEKQNFKEEVQKHWSNRFNEEQPNAEERQ